MDWIPPWYVLPAAFVLDILLGDPRWLPHPIRWMGRAIEILEPRFRGWVPNLVVSGALFAGTLIIGTWLLTFMAVFLAGQRDPLVGAILQIVIVYYCLSARSLEKAAMEVGDALDRQNLPEARQRVGMIVGRDVKQLDGEGVGRAAFETVAENLVDGVISPLFYAALGGAPLAMAYKMVNTLDSMVGYKNERYHAFGKAAARIDDFANYIPARLSVAVIALAVQLLSGAGRSALKTAFNDGARHASPNAGYSEAAFAGALGVRLGGPNVYHGRLVDKPYIGAGLGRVRTGHIRKACDLMLVSALLWTFMLTAVTVFL